MKQISYWAKNNIWQTRLIIVLIYVFLFANGLITGKLFSDINVMIPKTYFFACIMLTVTLWFFYPGKQKSNSSQLFSHSYACRKLFDFSLGAITFLMLIYTGNNRQHLFLKSESAIASKIIPLAKDSAINNPLIKNFIAVIKNMDVSKLSQKEKLRLIKDQIKAIKKEKEISKSDKTLLIIFSILIALGLLFGLAALSCSIECSGSGGLALLVALAGTMLIIVLLVLVIKRITKGNTRKKQVTQETNK